MSNLVARVVTFVFSLIVGALGLVFLPLGLMMPPFILFPLLLGIVALLSSLSASWVSAPLVSNQSYSRLLPVVGIAEATAAGLAILLLMGQALGFSFPIIIPFGIGTLIIVLSANVATWRYRSAERVLARDAQMTAGMLALSVLICVGVYALGAFLGLIGA